MKEKFDYLSLPSESVIMGLAGYFPEASDGLMERGEFEGIAGGRLRPCGKEGLDASTVPIKTGFVQSCVAFVVCRIDPGAVTHE